MIVKRKSIITKIPYNSGEVPGYVNLDFCQFEAMTLNKENVRIQTRKNDDERMR